MLRKEDCDFDRLSSGLKRLGQAAPNIKEMLIDAAAHTALADSEVTLEEAELLRAIANTLDCPLPPFLG